MSTFKKAHQAVQHAKHLLASNSHVSTAQMKKNIQELGWKVLEKDRLNVPSKVQDPQGGIWTSDFIEGYSLQPSESEDTSATPPQNTTGSY